MNVIAPKASRVVGFLFLFFFFFLGDDYDDDSYFC